VGAQASDAVPMTRASTGKLHDACAPLGLVAVQVTRPGAVTVLPLVRSQLTVAIVPLQVAALVAYVSVAPLGPRHPTSTMAGQPIVG
jgi:hypothetical protein